MGYDRETDEHSLQLTQVFRSQSAPVPITVSNAKMMMLFHLGGLLYSPDKAKGIAGLGELPEVRGRTSESVAVKCCIMADFGRDHAVSESACGTCVMAVLRVACLLYKLLHD